MHNELESLTTEDWYNRILKSGVWLKSNSSEYKIVKHIGSSGYGEMFLAITSENFLVGLKIILDQKYIENEVESIRWANRKSQDVILPFLDYFILQMEQDKYYIIVLKYFEGYTTLHKYLDKNLFQNENRVKFQSMIKQLIEKIHNCLGMAHNDIDHHKILIHSKTQQIRFFDLGFCISKIGYSKEEFEKLLHKDFDMIENIWMGDHLTQGIQEQMDNLSLKNGESKGDDGDENEDKNEDEIELHEPNECVLLHPNGQLQMVKECWCKLYHVFGNQIQIENIQQHKISDQIYLIRIDEKCPLYLQLPPNPAIIQRFNIPAHGAVAFYGKGEPVTAEKIQKLFG